MKGKKLFWCTPLVSAFLVLSACSGQQGVKEDKAGAAKLDYHDNNINKKGSGHVHGVNNHPNIIPSIDRAKKKTTNENRATSYGYGTNVYSLIGSSSLQQGGISSHLESRLATQGITGIKVFVLDDTVILARSKPEVTSSRYDEMQNQVLRNTNGQSGKGVNKGVDMNKLKNTTAHDNLVQAKDAMNKAFNGQVKILTVTNPQAITLIDRIKTNLKSTTPPYSQISTDINTLIRMTHQK